MYLLDTDVIIDLFDEDSNIIKNIQKISDSAVHISSLTLCELYRGAFLSSKTESEKDNISRLLATTEFSPLDENACEVFGRKNAELSAIGKATQEVDLMIASIAISNGLTLVTRNKKHFENIPGLKKVVW